VSLSWLSERHFIKLPNFLSVREKEGEAVEENRLNAGE
jgi:hypothetical protein